MADRARRARRSRPLSSAPRRLDAHPLVGEARSLGLIAAVEIVSRKGTDRRFHPPGRAAPPVRDACIARGLMVRAIRESIVMCPPYVITHDEIDRIVSTVAEALDEVAGGYRGSDPADGCRAE